MSNNIISTKSSLMNSNIDKYRHYVRQFSSNLNVYVANPFLY